MLHDVVFYVSVAVWLVVLLMWIRRSTKPLVVLRRIRKSLKPSLHQRLRQEVSLSPEEAKIRAKYLRGDIGVAGLEDEIGALVRVCLEQHGIDADTGYLNMVYAPLIPPKSGPPEKRTPECIRCGRTNTLARYNNWFYCKYCLEQAKAEERHQEELENEQEKNKQLQQIIESWQFSYSPSAYVFHDKHNKHVL